MKTIINNLWNQIIHIYNLFNSIKIIANPIVNFTLKIVIVLLVFMIVKTILKNIFKPKKNTYHPYEPVRQPATPQKPSFAPKTIDECISQEDLEFQLDKATKEIINTIQKNKQQIVDTLKKANQRIDVSWMESCNKILKISNTLDNNLAYYAKENLESSKFQYYAHLHFRSMVAADIVHKEYEKVEQSYQEINTFIVRMKSRPEFRGNYKAQIHEQKDQIKLIRNIYLDKVHNMNHETGILRDKIGAECGERGRKWWLERTRYNN